MPPHQFRMLSILAAGMTLIVLPYAVLAWVLWTSA
jgi:hypothetical protein